MHASLSMQSLANHFRQHNQIPIYVFIDVFTQLQIDRYFNTYIVMQNTDIRPPTTRYQKKINEIEKCINLNISPKINCQIRVFELKFKVLIITKKKYLK